MEMSLSEVEKRADALTQVLIHGNTGRQQALLLGVQIEGLRDLAQIKAIADNRAEHNVAVGMRERELAAMEAVAANIPSQGICGAQSRSVWTGERMVPQTCRVSAGHSGWHKSAQGMEWTEGEAAPTKPIADRLHELVSYCRAEADRESHEAETAREHSGLTARKQFGDVAADAYKDAADKLQELLMEGGI